MTTRKTRAPRDLLAARLLKLERGQALTNARLEVSNERLEHLARETRAGFKLLSADLAQVHRDFLVLTEMVAGYARTVAGRLENHSDRLGALEAKPD